MLGDLHKLEQGAVSVGKKLLGLGSSETPAAAQPADQVAQTGDASEAPPAPRSPSSATPPLRPRPRSVPWVPPPRGSLRQHLRPGPEAETTSATVVASMDAAEAGTDAAAGGIDAAIGSTGIGLLLIGLGIAVSELVQHWRGAWTGVRVAAEATWHFLDSEVVHPIEAGFKWLKGEIKSHLGEIEHDVKTFGPILLGPLAPLAELALHWKAVWSGMQDVGKAAWRVIDGDVIQPVERGFSRLVTGVEKDWTPSRATLRGSGER